MPRAQGADDRATFERLIARTASRPAGVEAIRAELERQTLCEPEPVREGLDELAALLQRRFAGDGRGVEPAIAELERAFPATPLVRLYGFALRREAGAAPEARASLDALLDADPGDPMATFLDGHLRSEPVVSESEDQRLANIAKIAATPLLSNPYSLGVGVVFEAIRGREHARVLDVGIGSGAQMTALLALLQRHEHRLKRLEIVGLDLRAESLALAAGRIADAARAVAGETEVTYEAVEGRFEALDEAALRAIAGAGLDAANATIALHEVPGESKLAALRALRRLEPGRLVISEWNFCLENVLPETSIEFVFNARSVAGAMVAALREQHTIDEARSFVRDWLSQGDGQLTCPSAERQECFLQVASWRALVQHCGFDVEPIDAAWLSHATHPGHASVAGDGSHIETSHYAGAVPIALLAATPSR
jgi:ubiquinone/menaquinone biosynthesis C-methylase UbiE